MVSGFLQQSQSSRGVAHGIPHCSCNVVSSRSNAHLLQPQFCRKSRSKLLPFKVSFRGQVVFLFFL